MILSTLKSQSVKFLIYLDELPWKHLPKFLPIKSYCTLIPSVVYYGLQFFMAQNCDFKLRGK